MSRCESSKHINNDLKIPNKSNFASPRIENDSNIVLKVLTDEKNKDVSNNKPVRTFKKKMTYINSQNEDKLMQAGRFQRKIEPKNKLVSKTVVMDSRRFQVSGLAK